MPKKTVKKTVKSATKKPVIKKTPAKHVEKPVFTPIQKPNHTGWSVSIYIYWFIILFFIAATFYILGRARMTYAPQENPAPLTEEELVAQDTTTTAPSAAEQLVAGNIDDVIAQLTTEIESGAATAQNYVLRGEAHLQYGDYSDALSDFNSAIAIDGSYAIAYYDRALLDMRLEDYQSALNDINNALALTANGAAGLSERDLYAKRGQVNLWLKNWEGAIADYTNSLARPDGMISPDVYAERAEAYTAMSDYNNAISDYSSAVRIIAEQIQAAATSAEREQMSSNAMSYFEKSAALNLTLGDTAAARSDLESALTIANALNNSEIIEHLQSLLNQLDAE